MQEAKDSHNNREREREREREAMQSYMYEAARKGDVVFLKQLSNTISGKEELVWVTHTKNNVTHIAAKLGHAAFVGEALSICPSLVSQKNSRGDTPLHVAARAGHMDVVKKLLSIPLSLKSSLREMEEGVFLPFCKMKNESNNTALHEALRNKHEEVARFLWDLDHDLAGFVNCAGESPLYLAAESKCIEVLKEIVNFLNQSELVQVLFDAATKGPDGQNPLHAAVLNRSYECVECLLGLGERSNLINKPDNGGKTALHIATTAKETKIIRELLQKDPSSAYMQDMEGRTPIFEAAISGNKSVLQEILRYCPDTIELRDMRGRNVLHLAVMSRSLQVEDFLSIPEIKELVNEPDHDGNTPLHLATMDKNYRIVTKLTAIKGVDLGATNNEGLTVLDICQGDKQLSYSQNCINHHLQRQSAPHGRHPGSWERQPKVREVFEHPQADLKELGNTLLLVATLLATITFAAAFTLPGGYIDHKPDNDENDPGSAVLIDTLQLKVFVLSDTVAVCSSMTVVFLLILAMVGDPVFLRSAIIYSKNLLYLGLGATMIAFISGLYSVIRPGSKVLAFIVCIIGSSVPFLILYLRRKSSTSSPRVLTLLKQKIPPYLTTPAGIKAPTSFKVLSSKVIKADQKPPTAFKVSRTPLIKTEKAPTALKISPH